MEFKKTGMNIDDLVKIISHEKEIITFLRDVQNEYRIRRAMGPDAGDELLHYTYAIDDLINRIPELEKSRKAYFQKKKEEEQEKIKKQLENQQKAI